MLVDLQIDKKKIDESIVELEDCIEHIKKSEKNLDINCLVEMIDSLKKVEDISSFIQEKIDIGIYKSSTLDDYNLEKYWFSKFDGWNSFFPKEGEDWFSYDNPRKNYGTADNVEQILKEYPELLNSDRKFFITFYDIYRKDQPDWGGFRYHKSGKYIGKQNPKSEYLYDDKHIDKIIKFHIYEIL